MGLMDLGGILSGPSSSGVTAAANGASANAGQANDFANWLSGQAQGSADQGAQYSGVAGNTFLQMLHGGDPTGAAGAGITGANHQYDIANKRIQAQFAGGGGEGSGFMNDMLANNEMARAGNISNLQTAGRQAGLQGILQMLQGLDNKTANLSSSTLGGYGTANGGYNTALGGYGAAAQMDNAGVQNGIGLLGAGAAGFGAYAGAGGFKAAVPVKP